MNMLKTYSYEEILSRAKTTVDKNLAQNLLFTYIGDKVSDEWNSE